uniref:GTPase, IMAP family member 2 n=2 Tax=Rhinopithecus TaxID=542827 RepID=A0A2K6LD14_RHIBE
MDQNEHNHWGERKVKGAVWLPLSKHQQGISGAAWLLFSEYRNL